ncbi:uncharacterized protein VP01_894g1 [Puccinia sorghi]|uniref:Uncharacterized protein n=1 Tax=Puccinia sorghi TaxID=27349 RepID=A0A0L6U7X7_9BASI|nr:uncharacterized protein VP01_894g1 [Puccinia sorghi]
MININTLLFLPVVFLFFISSIVFIVLNPISFIIPPTTSPDSYLTPRTSQSLRAKTSSIGKSKSAATVFKTGYKITFYLLDLQTYHPMAGILHQAMGTINYQCFVTSENVKDPAAIWEALNNYYKSTSNHNQNFILSKLALFGLIIGEPQQAHIKDKNRHSQLLVSKKHSMGREDNQWSH